MKNFLTLLLILALNIKGHCCMNEYHALLGGELVYAEAQKHNQMPVGRFSHVSKEELSHLLDRAYKMYKSSFDLLDYSDYAVMLTYNGRFREANTIFLKIEKKTPNHYATAANLGTTYELLGEIDSAIYWLNKAIKIKPDSHKGSEWIHLKILEAKKAANGDEQKLWNTDILTLGLGENEIPENRDNKNLAQISEQIYTQLSERMSFIQPKDPVIGRLLFDLGNVTAITQDVKSALRIYNEAKRYGFQSDLFAMREKHFKWLQLKADLRNDTESWVKENLMLTAILILLIPIAIIFLIVKIRRKRKNKDFVN
jgi:tetratricopeptide (TPR) repeat protein